MPLENPLNALTLIAAPAVLTNAAALMAMATSNRFGRTLDRCRIVANLVEKSAIDSTERLSRVRQFENLRRRTLLLLKSLRCIYLALGSLALASLMALLGAFFQPIAYVFGMRLAPAVSFFAGVLGVASLGTACWLLVQETHYAAATIKEEVRQFQSAFQLPDN